MNLTKTSSEEDPVQSIVIINHTHKNRKPVEGYYKSMKDSKHFFEEITEYGTILKNRGSNLQNDFNLISQQEKEEKEVTL